MISKLSPPPEVLKIARTLEKAGYETWCVGGAVRDALLGHAHLVRLAEGRRAGAGARVR